MYVLYFICIAYNSILHYGRVRVIVIEMRKYVQTTDCFHTFDVVTRIRTYIYRRVIDLHMGNGGIQRLHLALSANFKSYLIMNYRRMQRKYIGNLQAPLHSQAEIVTRRI